MEIEGGSPKCWAELKEIGSFRESENPAEKWRKYQDSDNVRITTGRSTAVCPALGNGG